jgi:hypothetical protein
MTRTPKISKFSSHTRPMSRRSSASRQTRGGAVVVGSARHLGVIRRRSDRQPDVPTAVGTSLLERRGRIDRAGQIGPTPYT